MSTGRAATVTRAAVKAGVVLAVLLAAGAGAGVVWELVWQPPTGVVARHQWLRDAGNLGQDFSATGWYVVVGGVTALLVTAVLAWLLPGDELAVLVAVGLGAMLGGWVMYHVGHALGPADPEVLARDAARGTVLPSDLTLGGLEGDPRPLTFDTSAMATFPLGALGGLAVTLLLTRGPARGRAHVSWATTPSAPPRWRAARG